MTLTLRDYNFGHPDARFEVSTDQARDTDFFERSFLMPGYIVEKDFNRLKYFFITGFKGSGKTAMLRHVAKLNEEVGYKTEFVLFKSDFREEDKWDLVRAANVEQVENNSNQYVYIQDFEDVWSWFLHQKIVDVLEREQENFYHAGSFPREYVSFVNQFRTGSKTPKSLIPALKNQQIEVKGEFRGFSAKYNADISFSKEGKYAKFSDVVRVADNCLSEMNAGNVKVVILIDELELFYQNAEQYSRDSRLIRDLVVSISRLNNILVNARIDISLFGAIRSEVVSSIDGQGKEIDKIILANGINIKWHDAGDANTQPLLVIVEKKINAGRAILGMPAVSVWTDFFEPDIYISDVDVVPTKRYLLNHSWYRPRDMIRILTLIQKRYPMDTSITGDMVKSIMQEYSNQSWGELTQELLASYSKNEVSAIRRLLNNFKRRFILNDFLDRCDSKSLSDAEVASLVRKFGSGAILNDLYRIGVIGNDWEVSPSNYRHRWSFRDQDELDTDFRMAIHRGLWHALSLMP